jgi:hypothetical protein
VLVGSGVGVFVGGTGVLVAPGGGVEVGPGVGVLVGFGVAVGLGVGVFVGSGVGISVGGTTTVNVFLQLALGSLGKFSTASGLDSGTEGATGLVPLSLIFIAVITETTAKTNVAIIIPIVKSFFLTLSPSSVGFNIGFKF